MAVVAFPHPFKSFYAEQPALKFGFIFVFAVTCLIVILALDTMVHSNNANGYSSLEFAGSNSEAIKVHLLQFSVAGVCLKHVPLLCLSRLITW